MASWPRQEEGAQGEDVRTVQHLLDGAGAQLDQLSQQYCTTVSQHRQVKEQV